MLKLYILLYKLTGYCPAWLELRTYKYAFKRLKRLATPGYYMGQPSQVLDEWICDYECRIGLYRASLLDYIKYFKNNLEVKWKTMIK